MTRKFPQNFQRVITFITVTGAVVILTACRSTEPQLTATAAYEEARSDYEILRATATVARARMQTTLDHAGTRVVQADAASTFLASNLINLINLGTESAFIEESLKQLAQFATQNTQTLPVNDAARSVMAEAPSTEAARAIVTPPAAPTSTASGPRLENIVMASGVNEYDCAIDVNPRFTPASTEIYVVGQAFNIPAGATITSSWQRAGTEVVNFSFYKEHEINDSCIWFFIDQTDTPFVAGSWSVEIRVDGLPLSAPVVFQIAGN